MSEQQPEARALPGVTRWRKKAVVVEAMQLTHESGPRVWEWADSKPTYGTDKFVDGLAIYTLEGRMRANFGDWIIRGIKGEFYPCREDIFTATYEPAGEEKAPAVPPAPVAAALDRETLGRIVHDTRLACEAARAEAEGRHRFNLGPWERRTYEQQETDMRIGESVAAAAGGSYVHAACDAQVERLQARARAAEATLAALRTVLLEGGQDDGTVRRRALAIISGEGEASRG